MAEDKRISELSPIPTVTPGALFPVVDEITGETMHARFDQMAATVDLVDYALKTYVDAQDIATLDDAKDYADLQDVTNLNAAKAYADGLVVGLWDDRGNFNASVNAYPSSGGSGTAGSIKKGDIWTVSVAGTLPTSQVVEVGDTVRALVDTPGNTQANWSIQQNNIGYTAENSANKTNTVTGNETSTTLYASIKGFVDYLVGMTWLTSTIFGTWIVGNTAKTTPDGGDSILISDLSDSNKTKKTTLTELWTNYLRAFVFATSLTTNRILKWDGNKLVDSLIIDNGTGVAIGGTTANALTQLQLLSTTQGLGLNNISGDLGTTVNGLVWYDSNNHIFKGVANGARVNFLAGSGLTNNRISYWNGSAYVDSRFQRNTNESINFLAVSGSNYTQFNDNGVTMVGTLDVTTAGTNGIAVTGRILNRNSDNYSYVLSNGASIFYFGLGGTNTGVFRTVSNICMSVNENGVAIGTGSVNARAQLHLQSTSKGFLPNVLTTAQRDAVSWVAGDAGMIIYNSTTNKHQGWNGTTWNDMY